MAKQQLLDLHCSTCIHLSSGKCYAVPSQPYVHSIPSCPLNKWNINQTTTNPNKRPILWITQDFAQGGITSYITYAAKHLYDSPTPVLAVLHLSDFKYDHDRAKIIHQYCPTYRFGEEPQSLYTDAEIVTFSYIYSAEIAEYLKTRLNNKAYYSIVYQAHGDCEFTRQSIQNQFDLVTKCNILIRNRTESEDRSKDRGEDEDRDKDKDKDESRRDEDRDRDRDQNRDRDRDKDKEHKDKDGDRDGYRNRYRDGYRDGDQELWDYRGSDGLGDYRPSVWGMGPTPYSREMLSSITSVPIYPMYYGVDLYDYHIRNPRLFYPTSHPNYSPDPIRFLCVGRLDPHKRYDLSAKLISEFRSANQSYPPYANARMTLVGDGWAKDQVLSSLNPYPFVDYLPWVATPDLVSIIQSHDALLMHSRSEGGPYVTLEALSCALPVHSSSVGISAHLSSLDPQRLIYDSSMSSLTDFVKRINSIESHTKRYSIIEQIRRLYSKLSLRFA